MRGECGHQGTILALRFHHHTPLTSLPLPSPPASHCQNRRPRLSHGLQPCFLLLCDSLAPSPIVVVWGYLRAPPRRVARLQAPKAQNGRARSECPLPLPLWLLSRCPTSAGLLRVGKDVQVIAIWSGSVLCAGAQCEYSIQPRSQTHGVGTALIVLVPE